MNCGAMRSAESRCDSFGQGDAPHEQRCWLRPMSRQAGAGMGWQCGLPRIGQEVLVGFVEGDIDRPVVLGALATAGAKAAWRRHRAAAPPMVTETSWLRSRQRSSRRRSGQSCRRQQPGIWHGGARSHHHPRDVRNQEQGSGGRAQPAAVRRQRQSAKSAAAKQLPRQRVEPWLVTLIHQAENYRGSFRGAGLELRTDAWGALRGGQGCS